MRLAHWFGLIALLILAAACTPAPKATETPVPNPQSLLNKAATAIQQAKSVHIKLQLTGAPSYVDPPLTPGGPGNSIAFVSADGAYLAPNRIQAKIVARLYGIPGEVDVIAIGDDQWMRNAILTGNRWIKREFAPGFNAATLISSDQGIEAAIRSFKDVSLVGVESVDGTPMYHIKGHASGADVSALTVGLIRGTEVTIDVYVVVDTGRVDRIIMVQPDTVTTKEPTPSTWTLEIYDYNASVQIDEPVVPATEQATAQATGQATGEATAAP